MTSLCGRPSTIRAFITRTAPLRAHQCHIKASRIAQAPFSPAICKSAISTASRGLHVAAGASGSEATGETFTITTPLYYVNASPHMGSAYPTIAADAIARFQRMKGNQVSFVTGTDEHGEKIALAAASKGVSPKEHCDAMVSEYKALWEALNVEYDSFIRTTDPHHEALVQEVLERVWEKGDIYKAKYEGYYCVDCEEYKDEGDMDEAKNCPVHRKPCQMRSEENWFFALSKYQEEIEKLVRDTDFVQPVSRRNEVLGWVTEGVRDFSISRANVEWGIPLKRDPGQTVYVWFDALNGYLSGLVGERGSLSEVQEKGWPASIHLIGKDILRFHAVYWPGMLLSAGLPLPRKVFGHGFLTKDGLKMGKSLGNVLEPRSLVDAYGADAVRYYFLRTIDFGSDGDFSEVRFRDWVNAALANDIGNLLNRSLSLLKKNCDSKFPLDASALPADSPLCEMAAEIAAQVSEEYANMRFHKALERVTALSSRGNLRMQEEEPWQKIKSEDPADVEKAKAVLVECVETIRIVAVLLRPVTPSLSLRIFLQLGLSPEEAAGVTWEDAAWGGIRAGEAFPKPEPVFKRMEGDLVTVAAEAGVAAGAAK